MGERIGQQRRRKRYFAALLSNTHIFTTCPTEVQLGVRWEICIQRIWLNGEFYKLSFTEMGKRDFGVLK